MGSLTCPLGIRERDDVTPEGEGRAFSSSPDPILGERDDGTPRERGGAHSVPSA